LGPVDVVAVLYKDKQNVEHRQVAFVAGDRSWLLPEDMRDIKIVRAPTYLEAQIVEEAADVLAPTKGTKKKEAKDGKAKRPARRRSSSPASM